MTDVDLHLQQAVVRLVRALDALERRNCLIGALVPRFLMRVPPPERTRDVDVVVGRTRWRTSSDWCRHLRARGYADVVPPMRFRKRGRCPWM